MVRKYMLFVAALLMVAQAGALGLSQNEIRLDTTGNTVGIEDNEICWLKNYSEVYCNKVHAILDNATLRLESLGSQETSKKGYIGKYRGNKPGSGYRVYIQ